MKRILRVRGVTKGYLLRACAFQPKMIHNTGITLKERAVILSGVYRLALALNAVKKWAKYFG